ncbi:uncharacterized protein F13E6.1 isoform X2 [Atheta coriaria]|uniref:uncharacterized protein F13E6.1 isoform X2 n=1 Tax=Dalotia coriaria TaxID=877792 RepID=UPI0031F44561
MNQTNDDDPPSLEYIEDPYISPTAITSETPSLDELDNFEYLDPNELDIFDLRQLDFDELNANSLTSLSGNDESINVEAEFFKVKRANAIIRAFFKNDFKRSVRVTYCDLTKPYLAKLPKESNFRRYLDISKGDEDAFAAGGDPRTYADGDLTEEELLKKQEEWKAELAQIEDEIATLRTVLAAKVRRSAELKRNLGITVWKEVSEDINQGIKNVKDSNVYQKTTSLIGGLTAGVTNKLGQMRHSESFKSFEEKAASAMESVKTKVGSVSRSGSQQSLNDIRSRSGSIATSPTIPEDKPIA